MTSDPIEGWPKITGHGESGLMTAAQLQEAYVCGQQSEQLRLAMLEIDRMRAALMQIRHIRDLFPFDAPWAATECIRIAKKALGE